jgi:hypothetical protein
VISELLGIANSRTVKSLTSSGSTGFLTTEFLHPLLKLFKEQPVP